MAKRPTPKKQQAGSSTSARYKTFQNKARKRLLNMAKVVECSDCAEMRLQHAACATCGSYNGRQVIDMDKKKDKVTKIKA